MKKLSVNDVQYIAYKLAKKFMDWDEPIPDPHSCQTEVLKSCLSQPFIKFGGEYLYPGLYKKAAALFYFIIKNHPFENGNKRIAVTSLVIFLFKNSKWINVSNNKLYEFALTIAKSKPKQIKIKIDEINKFIESNVIKV